MKSTAKFKLIFLACILVSAFVFFSCGSREHSNPLDPEYSGSESELIVAENTVVVNETNLSEPVINGDTYTFSYSGLFWFSVNWTNGVRPLR